MRKAVSFNPNITNKLKQTEIMFQNCVNYGKDVLIIKCADLYDNIDYVAVVKEIETQNKLIEKYRLFIAISYSKLKNENIFQDLIEKIKHF